jgi:CRP/FNR family transcriptional regulator, anaerobic regulatory protein
LTANKWINRKKFLEIFPFFRKGSGEAVADLLSRGRYSSTPANTILQLEGQPCNSAEFQLSGVKRNYKVSRNGREITMYEVGPGEICIVNVACILSNSVSPTHTVSLTDIAMLTFSAKDFRELVAKYEEIRAFIFAAVNQRFASIMELTKEVAFGKMDERLLDYLVEKSEDGKLSTTHQKIAQDLGTAREVVSRLLKELERKGVLHLSRNLIELTQP